jgi:hypothetical protein
MLLEPLKRRLDALERLDEVERLGGRPPTAQGLARASRLSPGLPWRLALGGRAFPLHAGKCALAGRSAASRKIRIFE